MTTNFKILVLAKSSGGLDGGRAISQQLIEYDRLEIAEKAYGILRVQLTSIDVTVIKLW